MSYKKDNIKELFAYFYTYVNNIINDIHKNNNLSKKLFYSKYLFLNNKENIRLPLTICLGGGGYTLYKNIFENENLKYDIDLTTYDYDISFSFTAGTILNDTN